MSVIGDLELVVTASTGGLTAGLSSVEGSVKSLTGVLSNGGASLQVFGGLAAGLGIGLMGLATGAIAVSTKAAADMQTALTDLSARSGMSKSDADKFGQQMLATAGQTIFSAQEMTGALAPVSGQLEEMFGHVLTAAEGITIMKSASDLATASDQDLNSTTSTLVTMMQAFQLNANDASDAADLLFQTSKGTGVGMDELESAMALIHGRMGSLGPSMQDMAAFMQEFADKGLTSRRALMAINTGMSQLTGTSTATTDELKTLGVSVFDSSGKFIGMASVISQLHDKLAPLTQEQRLHAETALFGASASKTLDDIISGGLPTYDKALAAVTKQGAAHDAAAAKMGDFNNKMKAAKSAISDATVSLGNAFLPIVTNLITTITPFIVKIGDWIEHHQKLVAQIIIGVAAFGAFLTIIGTLLMIIGSIRTIVGVVGPVIGVLVTVIGAVGAPVLLVGAAIALLAFLVVTHWKKITSVTSEFVTNFVKFIKKIPTELANLLRAVGKFVLDFIVFWNITLPLKILEGLAYIAGYLIGFATVKIPEFINDIVMFFSELPGKIMAWLNKTRDDQVNFWLDIALWLKTNVPKIIDDIVNFFKELPGNIIKALSNLATGIWNAILAIPSLVMSKLGEIQSWGTSIGNSFIKGIEGALGKLGDVFSKGLEAGTKAAKGKSPPDVGPLKDIDVWGYNIGMSWVGGFTKAVGTLSVGMPSFQNLQGIGAGNMNAQTVNNSPTTTMNNTFNVNSEGTASNVAAQLSFQLNHRGVT